MSSLNKVQLIGNLCHDPSVKSFDNGGKVAQVSLATNTPKIVTKEGKEIPERVEYHNIVFNRKGLVDVVEKYLKKGSKIYVEGELRTRSYDVDGEKSKRYITEIYVSNMIMLSSKNNGVSKAPIPEPEDYNTSSNVDDDDLPF